MSLALVALGANLGDREATLAAAVAELRALADVRVAAQSRWQRTLPVGGPAGQGEFLNGAVLLETSLAPEALLARLHGIEARYDRQRAEHWGARTLDLDLLLYDDLVCQTPTLTLPHPRMAFRRFVLAPAAEVAGSMVHPTIGWSVEQLLRHLDSADPYLALAGVPGVGKGRIARAVAAQLSGSLLRDPIGVADVAAAGPRLAQELEFVRRRVETLRRAARPTPAQVTVSDFWIGQSLAYTAVDVGAQEAAELRGSTYEAVSQIVQPKLLAILLDPQVVGLPSSDHRRRLQESLVDWARQVHAGPVVRFAPADDTDAISELTTALQAMR